MMTRCGLDCSRIPAFGQLLTQTPQPRQISSCNTAFFILGRWGLLADTKVIASTGQTLTHFAAAIADCVINSGQKVGRVDRLEKAKPSAGNHGFAATAAAVADEVDALPYVFTELH